MPNKPKILLFAFIALMYALTIRGSVGNTYPSFKLVQQSYPPFETSLERGRYAQVVALSETGDVKIDKFYMFLKPDIAWYNGHFYSTFPPGLAFVAVPFYLLGRFLNLSQVFTFLTTTAFSILTAWLVYKCALKLNLNEQAAVFVTILFSLATVIWAYSVTLSAHTLSAFLLILCFYEYLQIGFKKDNFLPFLILGVAYSLNLFVDYPNLVIFLPIVIMAFIKSLVSPTDTELEVKIPYDSLVFFLTFFIVFMLFGIFNQTHYGRFIAFSNTFSLKTLEQSGILKNYNQLTNTLFSNVHYANRFSITQTIYGIYVLLFSHDRGLFYFFPVTLLAILGSVILFRKQRYTLITIALTFLANVFVYGSYDDPWGGWSFGPRYLIVSLPLIALLCGIAFNYALRNRFYTFGAMLILFWSQAVALIGALTTNAVPPSVEAATTHMKDNFLYNLHYLEKAGTSSFAFKTLFHFVMTPSIYALLLLLAVTVFSAYLIIFNQDYKV